MAPLSEEQVRLVQESWGKVAPVGGLVAEMFYARLFAMAPPLRALFKDDAKQQQAKLVAMITVAVQRLHNPAELLTVLRALGQRHAYYGVQPAHYELVEVALLWTLERGLGDTFTPAVKEAWSAAYGLMASTMKAAAHMGNPAARV